MLLLFGFFFLSSVRGNFCLLSYDMNHKVIKTDVVRGFKNWYRIHVFRKGFSNLCFGKLAAELESVMLLAFKHAQVQHHLC